MAAQPFDPAEFPFAFLAAFGNKETTIKRLRKGDSNTSDVPGAVLQRNNIHIAVCESGAVSATLRPLRDRPKTASAQTHIENSRFRSKSARTLPDISSRLRP